MRIAALLSGGVDSSVALNMMVNEGCHDITAYYLKIWLEDELASLGDCPWENDLKFARAVCERLDVPFRIVSLQTEYLEKVVHHVLSELKAGRTPSPDILCNQRVKFGEFLGRVDAGIDRVVSGHYAQVETRNGHCLLKRSPDPVKDQTYFLSNLSQGQLRRAHFPIGHLTKADVRALAREFDLPTQDRRDSQGICFLGKINYPEFVRFHLGEQEGEIVERESGRSLGAHRGFWFFTIGQREGLGLGGGPWYVVKKDAMTNTVYVSHRDNRASQARHRFTVTDLNWISRRPDREDLQVKIRHGPQMFDCRIALRGEDHLSVTISCGDPGIAPGQFAVFYDKEICLGGGVIAS